MNNKIKLIVTDDASEFTQENLNILQSKNISVIFCAKDGEELCDKIKRESPDVVLMDSFMTRLDAIGVMRSITRESTKVPVFMVYSSFHSTVLEREIMNSGASYFVLKPYNISELSAIISDLSDLSKKNNFGKGRVIDAFGIEMKVTDILHEIGVPAHIKGYHYLRDSIIMSVEHPLPMIVRILKMSSNPGDTILDPFAGSGTSLVAAKILNRNAIGFELDSKYKAECEKRLNSEGNIPSYVFDECRSDDEKKEAFLNAISNLSKYDPNQMTIDSIIGQD